MASSSDIDVDTLSIKALRELITSAGLSYGDCLEKTDLKNRAREALTRNAEKAKTAVPPSFRTKVFAGYECTLSKNCDGQEVDLAVVLLHGFGATSEEFKFLDEVGDKQCPGKRIAWIFPQAPIGSQGASEWWQLDAMKWFGAAQQGGPALAALIREVPPGLTECRDRLKLLISEVQKELGNLLLEKFVLAGFSQGAMTSMDLALQLDTTVAGVVLLSGAPIVVDQWAQRLQQHQGINVFISHGRSDPILPYAASGWCKDLLENGKAKVVKTDHGGGHELHPTTLTALMQFLAAL